MLRKLGALAIANGLAAGLSLLAVLAAYHVADRYFERVPHIEDEIALVWQARAVAEGRLTVPTPPHPKHFLVPFVVDYDGQRFGKYPLGWPALLSLGVRAGARELVNPLLAGLGVWLTYVLGRRLMGELAGLLAAALTLTSPFFLMNSGTLLSHPFGLVLSASFALAWLDAFGPGPAGRRPWLAAVIAALSLGALALTRPLTAVGLALPFGLHGLALLWRGGRKVRLRLGVVAVLAGVLAGLHFVWQWALTGDPFLNPYTLWWPYDKVGFGPGVGRVPGGHNLTLAYVNTRFSLWVGLRDLFGWGPYSWIFLPFGLGALRRNRAALLVGSAFASLVIVYLAYWVGSWLYGPRYFFEGLHSLTLLSAAGIAGLAGWPLEPRARVRRYIGWRRLRPLLVTALLAFLVVGNLRYYTPLRLSGMRGLHGFSRARLEPFLTPEARELAPALVIVHPRHWTEYGALLELEDPFLTTPFIFTFSGGPEDDAALIADFPERRVIHYYPEDPWVLYLDGR